MYHGVDFWHLFGKGQKVLEHKVRELRGEGEQDDVPPDMKASLETLDFLIDAWESLSEENMKLLTDQLWDCREIDSNVIIARELIAPLLGPQDVIVLNSHHAASSELYALAKGLSKLRVASTMSIWRGLGIGKCNTDIIFPPLLNWTKVLISVCNLDALARQATVLLQSFP